MHEPKPQPLHPTEDLGLAVEDAAKVVGGDVKPTAEKPAECLVFKLSDVTITAP
ncbi:MAG: hypothetical protein ACTHMY_02010 [Solirubrobacteraceae bacterium]